MATGQNVGFWALVFLGLFKLFAAVRTEETGSVENAAGEVAHWKVERLRESVLKSAWRKKGALTWNWIPSDEDRATSTTLDDGKALALEHLAGLGYTRPIE